MWLYNWWDCFTIILLVKNDNIYGNQWNVYAKVHHPLGPTHLNNNVKIGKRQTIFKEAVHISIIT